METLLYEYVIGELRSGRLTYRQVAEGSGVSRRTIEKIARREIADPGISRIERIATFLRSQDAARHRARHARAMSRAGSVVSLMWEEDE